MATLDLTDAELDMILDARKREDRAKFVVLGVYAAADHLHSLGEQSAGGDGTAINPATGQRWGESWFVAEESVRRWAATWKGTV